MCKRRLLGKSELDWKSTLQHSAHFMSGEELPTAFLDLRRIVDVHCVIAFASL